MTTCTATSTTAALSVSTPPAKGLSPKDTSAVRTGGAPVGVVHLLDHQGTIRRLIEPLGRYPEHHILRSFDVDGSDSMCRDPLDQVFDLRREYGSRLTPILHATEWHLPFRQRWAEIAGVFPTSAVFMHVTPTFLHACGRSQDLSDLARYTAAAGRAVLVPGRTVARHYAQHGIRALPTQLGITPPAPAPASPHVPASGDPVQSWAAVTCCTTLDAYYQEVKGIPGFLQVVGHAGIAASSLIVGHDGPAIAGVHRRLLPHAELIAALARARCYIQLSTSEAYNLTAVEAKLLRIPVIVSATEGHLDNVRFGHVVTTLEEAVDALVHLTATPDTGDRLLPDVAAAVEANYRDARRRESLPSFRRALVRAVAALRRS